MGGAKLVEWSINSPQERVREEKITGHSYFGILAQICWENTDGIQKGAPPSSAPQNQTSTSTWNSTSYT